MTGIPERTEAADTYFKYIDRIPSTDIVGQLASQMDDQLAVLRNISEEKSLHRYAPGKWSIRQLWNHVNDCERLFVFRAFWFARGFDSPMPSFDQDPAAVAARADDFAWSSHVEEFRGVRLSTVAFFRNLPSEAWSKKGIASGNPCTVRALAYIVAGHAAHHASILQERYLQA